MQGQRWISFIEEEELFYFMESSFGALGTHPAGF
jgi:hypothetical protein